MAQENHPLLLSCLIYNGVMNNLCPFCDINPDRVVLKNDGAVAILDGFPVSPGHMLIIPITHVPSLFHLTKFERNSVLSLLEEAHIYLVRRYQPDGFNIGINDGESAGQTVPHLHIHIIPRYKGDQEDPRGGVRLIFPDKARYWE